MMNDKAVAKWSRLQFTTTKIHNNTRIYQLEIDLKSIEPFALGAAVAFKTTFQIASDSQNV